jgi:His Kinase A (phospho-acceptor) domain
VRGRTAELATANEELRTEISKRRHAQETLQTTQGALAHVTRVTSMGELMASIAHEVNQPLTAIVTNGNACKRWLAGETPNLDEARAAATRMISEGNRVSNLIREIRGGSGARSVGSATWFLASSLLTNGTVFLRRRSLYKRVSAIDDRSRELSIISQSLQDPVAVLVAVRDSGTGISPQNLDRLFETFFTQDRGHGHGTLDRPFDRDGTRGKLWAEANPDHGATFQFMIPAAGDGSLWASRIQWCSWSTTMRRFVMRFQSLIRSVGLHVESYASAQEFLRSKRPDLPGCIVLDVRLPGFSGLELQRKLTEVSLEGCYCSGPRFVPGKPSGSSDTNPNHPRSHCNMS